MRVIRLLLAVLVGVCLTGCGNSGSTNPPAATNTATNFASGNPITAMPDYIGAVGQAQQYSVKQIDLAQVNQAIQQFNAAEGRYPKDLQELIPNYLAKMPQIPLGYRIAYDASTGTAKVVHP